MCELIYACKLNNNSQLLLAWSFDDTKIIEILAVDEFSTSLYNKKMIITAMFSAFVGQ